MEVAATEEEECEAAREVIDELLYRDGFINPDGWVDALRREWLRRLPDVAPVDRPRILHICVPADLLREGLESGCITDAWLSEALARVPAEELYHPAYRLGFDRLPMSFKRDLVDRLVTHSAWKVSRLLSVCEDVGIAPPARLIAKGFPDPVFRTLAAQQVADGSHGLNDLLAHQQRLADESDPLTWLRWLCGHESPSDQGTEDAASAPTGIDALFRDPGYAASRLADHLMSLAVGGSADELESWRGDLEARTDASSCPPCDPPCADNATIVALLALRLIIARVDERERLLARASEVMRRPKGLRVLGWFAFGRRVPELLDDGSGFFDRIEQRRAAIRRGQDRRRAATALGIRTSRKLSVPRSIAEWADLKAELAEHERVEFDRIALEFWKLVGLDDFNRSELVIGPL